MTKQKAPKCVDCQLADRRALCNTHAADAGWVEPPPVTRRRTVSSARHFLDTPTAARRRRRLRRAIEQACRHNAPGVCDHCTDAGWVEPPPGRPRRRQRRPDGDTQFPLWDGVNHGPAGLVRRATKDPVGGYAPLRVVPDVEDQPLAAGGYNLLAAVCYVGDLAEGDARELALLTQLPVKQLVDRERDRERALWPLVPRVTVPGIDIDVVDVARGTPEGRAAAAAIASAICRAEARRGVILRTSYSGGAGRGSIHLEWAWDGSVRHPDLLRVMLQRAKSLCAEAAVPTSDAKDAKALAFADFSVLRHRPDNRGRLWRPLGGLHKKTGGRKVRCNLDDPPATVLTASAIASDLLAHARDPDCYMAGGRRGARPRNRLPKLVLEIKDHRSLQPLASVLQRVRSADSQERQRQRLAWSATLLTAGLSVDATAWICARGVGNPDACVKIAADTAARLRGGRPCMGRGYLESTCGTDTLQAFVLALGQVAGQPHTQQRRQQQHARQQQRAPRQILRRLAHDDGGQEGVSLPAPPRGGLQEMRVAGPVPRRVRESLQAYAKQLRAADLGDVAANALERPAWCRRIRERVDCTACGLERSRRRLACEDELCAWCHATRVLAERDLAGQAWAAQGVARVAIMEAHGFRSLGELEQWWRDRHMHKLRALRVRTHRRVVVDGVGRIDHGVVVVCPTGAGGSAVAWYRGSMLACPDGVTSVIRECSAADAIEQCAWARWNTHVAWRAAAVAGELADVARITREQFRRRAATGSPQALPWPGRGQVRASIVEAARARALERQTTEGGGDGGGDDHQDDLICPGCDAAAVYCLLVGLGDDEMVVHRSPYPHSMAQGIRHLEEHARMEELAARAAASTA